MIRLTLTNGHQIWDFPDDGVSFEDYVRSVDASNAIILTSSPRPTAINTSQIVSIVEE